MATMNQIQAASSAVETALAAEAITHAVALTKLSEVLAAVSTEAAAMAAAETAYYAARDVVSESSGLNVAAAADNAARATRESAESALRVLLFDHLGVQDPNS